MKRLAIIFLFLTVIGCSGSKKVIYSPVGSWNYTVVGTPNGDAKGTFILTRMENGIKGMFKSNEYGESNMENLSIGENNELKCTMYLSGIDLSLNGIFEGDTFSGNVDAGQTGTFPITATRNISN